MVCNFIQLVVVSSRGRAQGPAFVDPWRVRASAVSRRRSWRSSRCFSFLMAVTIHWVSSTRVGVVVYRVLTIPRCAGEDVQ